MPLTDELVAARAARLANVAEQTATRQFGHSDLVYVIGTEVPVPGGAHEDLAELAVTTPEAARTPWPPTSKPSSRPDWPRSGRG